jgi:hypothetical protein
MTMLGKRAIAMQARYRQSRTIPVRDCLLCRFAPEGPGVPEQPWVEGRVGIMGQLMRHTQQPVTGMLDQLRQHIVQMHATTSGLP